MYCINTIKLAIAKLILLLAIAELVLLLVHFPKQYLKRTNGIITQLYFLINVDNTQCSMGLKLGRTYTFRAIYSSVTMCYS